MLQTNPNQDIQIIPILTALRKEWQETIAGESLLDVEGNVGLILVDLVNALGLTTQEQTLVLGSDLFDEMQDILVLPAQN